MFFGMAFFMSFRTIKSGEFHTFTENFSNRNHFLT